jgi:ribonucleotide monophosphatase NagD (HAD superfamily)
MYNLAIERLNLPNDQVLGVGDRLDTDILGGQQAGVRTAVVLTGVTTRQEAESWSPPPDLIADSLSTLLGVKVSS